ARTAGPVRPGSGHGRGAPDRRSGPQHRHAGNHHAGRRATFGGGGMRVLRTLFLRREAGIFVMIVLFCLAVGLVKPQFLTLNSLRIILLLTPLILIGAMGQMMVIVPRHVDLSIGSTLGFSAMLTGMMFKFH